MASDLYKEIDKLDKRALRVAARWGTASDVYKDYEKKIERLIPKEYIRRNNNGVIQISKSAGAQKAISSNSLATIRETTKTTTEYTKKITREFQRQYGGGKPTREQLQEFVDKKSAVKAAAEDGTLKIKYKEAGEKGAAVMSKSRKTYDELYELLQTAKAEEEAAADELKELYLGATFDSLADYTGETPFD